MVPFHRFAAGAVARLRAHRITLATVTATARIKHILTGSGLSVTGFRSAAPGKDNAEQDQQKPGEVSFQHALSPLDVVDGCRKQSDSLAEALCQKLRFYSRFNILMEAQIW
jgi:hypothetical protein